MFETGASSSWAIRACGAVGGIRTRNLQALDLAPLPSWDTTAWYSGRDSNPQPPVSETGPSASWDTRAWYGARESDPARPVCETGITSRWTAPRSSLRRDSNPRGRAYGARLRPSVTAWLRAGDVRPVSDLGAWARAPLLALPAVPSARFELAPSGLGNRRPSARTSRACRRPRRSSTPFRGGPELHDDELVFPARLACPEAAKRLWGTRDCGFGGRRDDPLHHGNVVSSARFERAMPVP